jgi:nickel superoxide dismutase
MFRQSLIVLTLLALTLGAARTVSAHCEVPCGIYADQHRFESMLEDTATIQKAMAQIAELNKKGDDALAANQLARWVATKESHATHIQHVIAQYFMSQRLKPADPADADAWSAYVGKLTSAHAVMRAAMKCKQSVDPAHAEAARKAILAFHKAYEGKK